MPQLNELEYVKGEIFANVWQTRPHRADLAVGRPRHRLDRSRRPAAARGTRRRATSSTASPTTPPPTGSSSPASGGRGCSRSRRSRSNSQLHAIPNSPMSELHERIGSTARGQMAWLEAGAGWPVILVHGFPLRAEMWRPQLEHVPAGGRFIAPDLRGFGGAPLGNEPPSMDTYAPDVFALMDSLQSTPRRSPAFRWAATSRSRCTGWRRGDSTASCSPTRGRLPTRHKGATAASRCERRSPKRGRRRSRPRCCRSSCRPTPAPQPSGSCAA